MSLKPQLVDFDAKWDDVKLIVNQILKVENVDKQLWNKQFYDIYSLCIATPEPFDNKLYSHTKDLLEKHVKHKCNEIDNCAGKQLLTKYHKEWSTYSIGIDYVDILYIYLNNHLVNRNRVKDADLTYGTIEMDFTDKLQEVGELGLDIWRREVILPLKDKLLQVLLDEIKMHRQNKEVQTSQKVIHSVIQSIVTVRSFVTEGKYKLYEKCFEAAYLKETGNFYKNEASDWLKDFNVSQYMIKVKNRLQDELNRSQKFLPECSHDRTQSELVRQMVQEHLPTLHAEVSDMVANEQAEDLVNMHFLCKKVENGITLVVQNFKEHVKTNGLQVINNLRGENIATDFTENLIVVYKKYKKMVGDVFSSDTLFADALDKAFDDIINYKSGSKCMSPELLAKYTDQLLKRSNKSLSETDIDEKLGQSITLFKYIQDKDVFHKFYARYLAKRLIQQLSHSMDLEENMINRLKQACGYEYTSKLHRMYTDISLSQGLNSNFTTWLSDNKTDLGVNYNVNILQAGAWPMSQANVSPFSVPQELEQSIQAFESFYAWKFNGRKLTWLHYLCGGEIKCCHLQKQYIITMCSFQMAMILMFQEVDSVTCIELKKHTGLTNELFQKNLQSLLDHKFLVCNDEKLEDSSIVSLNFAFSNKRTKFKIVVISAKENQIEMEKTRESVEDDRKLYLQAAIVRIMKTRKIIKHNTLIEEVINQSVSRFSPQIPMIKKCIESLIDKQYIERSAENNDEYSYIA